MPQIETLSDVFQRHTQAIKVCTHPLRNQNAGTDYRVVHGTDGVSQMPLAPSKDLGMKT